MHATPRPLRRLPSPLAAAVAAALAAGHVPAVRAQPGTAPATAAIHIAAQPLGQALNELARQARLQMTFAAAEVAGRSAPAVSGQLTVAQALDALLAGSGLAASIDGSRVVVRRAATALAARLPTVTVSGPRESATGPANGYLALSSEAASKTARELFTTPGSVSVVTQHQIEAQATRSLSEALRYTAGIASEYEGVDARFDTLAVRGFNAGSVTWLNGLKLDGGSGAGNNWTRPQVDPYVLNRIEVLKGPASALYGAMVPGGLVALSSKRADTAPDEQSVELTAGSHAQRRLGADLHGRNAQQNLAWRLVALDSSSASQVDFAERRRRLVAPSVQIDLDRRGQLQLWSVLQRDRGGNDSQWLPAHGTLYPNPYGRLATSRNIGEPGLDRFDRDQDMGGISLKYALSDRLALRHESRVQRIRTDLEMVQSDMYSEPDPVEGAWDWRSIQRYATRGRGAARSLASDTRLDWQAATGPVQHTVTAGIDYYRDRFTANRDTAPVGPDGSDGVLDIHDPRYGMEIGSFSPLSAIRSRQRTTGLYLQDALRWERLHLIAGLRHDRSRVTGASTRRGETADLAQRDSATSGRVGVLYDAGAWAPHLSYGTSFEPVAGVTAAGQPFRPMRGRQLELGAKLRPRKDWMLAIAAFDIRQTNRLTDDPVLGFPEQVQTGQVRSRGVEVELNGRLSRNWSATGSFTRLDTRVLRSEVPEELGQPLLFVPRQQAALWLDYTLTGRHALQGAVLGMGARYVGKTRNGDIAMAGGGYAGLQIPSHTVFDARMSMLLGRVWPQLRDSELALNISNLTDRRYVSTCGSLWTCNWGLARQVSLTFTGRW
jgi:iron complex outermembrane receptor protein